MDLETAYLEHILLHLRTGDRDDSLLTTFMNSWFAHHSGGEFLDGKGKPRWLSTDAAKKKLASSVHAISAQARLALSEGRIKDLVIDHTIPSAELIRGLRQRDESKIFENAAALRDYLRHRFTLALITKAEHDGPLRSCRSTMAGGWSDKAFQADASTRFCRYEAIGFEVQVHHA